ncbi:hypothetical protein PPERSA_02911 [Pseudocohnilembus persalinus]|uniref:Transmembrane protein n=1 Tax=Pseudocohnilembus persalinus TaxID=266149 RepID=A0A0V0QN21_PSEPJ|nr:hypothetical protein PPERSA_02911 [Pseudocohnilembus persalinus]|eukprot:KRX03532.1 hypothetical protein PPERSA_02911 [Pseudocohnilembus persalinus]
MFNLILNHLRSFSFCLPFHGVFQNTQGFVGYIITKNTFHPKILLQFYLVFFIVENNFSCYLKRVFIFWIYILLKTQFFQCQIIIHFFNIFVIQILIWKTILLLAIGLIFIICIIVLFIETTNSCFQINRFFFSSTPKYALFLIKNTL